MDELKHKILGLLNKQGPKIPSMGFSDDNYHFFKVSSLSINSKTVTESDRPSDQDILESIEAAYFSMNEDFDICRFELNKLPESLDCDQIQRDFKQLKQQHQVVSKKVLQLILEQQNNCNEEFQRILSLCDVLKAALDVCKTGRKDLIVAETQLRATLSILANYRRRSYARVVLKNLHRIKTMCHTDDRLRMLMEREDFSGAVRFILDCQTSAQTYKYFTCVAQLNTRLNEILETTEQQLDRVLAQTCYEFDPHRYSSLYMAFSLLGKTQISVDHLHMYYVSAIYTTAMETSQKYAKYSTISQQRKRNSIVGDLSSSEDILIDGGSDGIGTSKRSYKQLCQFINSENFIPCLVHLCRNLFKIVLSYYKLVKWHKEQDEVSIQQHSQTNNSTESRGLEESLNNQYVRQKLDHNLLKIWQDVQSKVAVLVSNASLSQCRFEQFLRILAIVRRMIAVGDEFSASNSTTKVIHGNSNSMELEEAARAQSSAYFVVCHAQRMEELKVLLENEEWEACPVKPNFGIEHLHEFRPLRRYLLKDIANKRRFKPKLNEQHSRTIRSEISPNVSSPIDFGESDSGTSRTTSTSVCRYFVRYADVCSESKTIDEIQTTNMSTPFDVFEKHQEIIGISRSREETEADIMFKRDDISNCSSSSSSPAVSDHFDEDNNDDDNDEDDDDDVELQRDFVVEDDDDDHEADSAYIMSPKKAEKSNIANDKNLQQMAPPLTSTTLVVLRHIGRYLQMARLLRPIATQVVDGIKELYDYYLYAVHEFFANDLAVSGATLYTSRLNATLKRIRDSIIPQLPTETAPDMSFSSSSFSYTSTTLSTIGVAQRSSTVDLTRHDELHGLATRLVAVESVVFLADKCYRRIEDYVSKHLLGSDDSNETNCSKDDNCSDGGQLTNADILHEQIESSKEGTSFSRLKALQQFYSQTIACATDLRRPIYMCVAAQALDLRQILIAMSKINWEIKEVMSQHNNYIDVVLKEIEIFTLRLEQIDTNRVHVPFQVIECLWENIAHLITHTLVQGFSEAKKCSNAGRALMQLDFAQFLTKYEKFMASSFIPITNQVSFISHNPRGGVRHSSLSSISFHNSNLSSLNTANIASSNATPSILNSSYDIDGSNISSSGGVITPRKSSVVMPHRDYVENYVKAFYLPENELEKWIQGHTEYSTKHMFGLVNCVCQNNKKLRQKLLQVIEEVEKQSFIR